jgi:hypothetical protein
MRLPVAICLLCLAAPAAWAGAWPREAGTGFLTLSTRVAWPQDVLTGVAAAEHRAYSTAYLEYGLTDRLTLGLDLGRGVSGDGKTILFAQMPVRSADSGAQITGQLGLGRISGEAVLRPGLSVGWGRDGGWLSFDAVAEVALDTGATDLKIDATWGRNLAQDRKLIVQLQAGLPHDDPGFARLAPSVVLPAGERLKLELGATWGLTGDTDMGLKLGLWSSF